MSVSAEGSTGPGEADGLLPAQKLLFTPLGATDMPAAVVSRVRAAIRLGLLPDKARLPKEAVLAAQLDVTTFALREALAQLRTEGLIQTRPGKYGGSFVTYPEVTGQLEKAELVSLSAVELRDLADWRQMLTGQSAVLATRRARSANLRALEVFAAKVAEAGSAAEARRWHGRFHLEMASASQSTRLTRAEFSVHEQVDWLFGLVLDSADGRSSASASLGKLAQAVAARDEAAARTAAEAHVGLMMGELARLRMESLASDRTAARDGDLAGEIERQCRRMSATLTRLSGIAAGALSETGDLAALKQKMTIGVLQAFTELPEFVDGAGVLAEHGVLPDSPYWIEWWRRTPDGPVKDNHHVLDPAREDFYDYPSMEIMSRPRETGAMGAYGPYIDYGGEDEYIVTISVPIERSGTFLGVVCADLLVSTLEAWLSPLLASSPESVIVNSEGRVVLSNAVQFGVGDELTIGAGYRETHYPEFGWTLHTRK
ncbi:FCD domain-containing protein [Amycolatopsis jejuensis]|uniref:FCD domain-containing protein n=1 Tax=Amycolatopsis jejuensis TaxID=330084 RepID=UPI00068EFEE3|nr:FCD domain-containing protein [Amycolatopsis jejuensis]